MIEEKEIVHLREGCPLARDKILILLLPFSRKIARSFAKRAKCDSEELEAEASWLLLTGLMKAYITVYLQKNMLKFMYRTGRYHASKIKLDIMRIIPPKEIIDVTERDQSDRKEIFRKEEKELLEILESCVTTPQERVVFEGRLAGKKLRELSREMSLPIFRVRLIRLALFKKFQKKKLELS